MNLARRLPVDLEAIAVGIEKVDADRVAVRDFLVDPYLFSREHPLELQHVGQAGAAERGLLNAIRVDLVWRIHEEHFVMLLVRMGGQKSVAPLPVHI